MKVEIIKDHKKDDLVVECNIIRVRSGDNWYEISAEEEGINIFAKHQILVIPNSSNSVSINSRPHHFIQNAKSRKL